MIDVDVDVDATSVLLLLGRTDDAVSMSHVSGAFTSDGVVVEALQQQVRARFAGQGDDASGRWEPLSAATIDMRTRMGYGAGPINRRTGRMYEWLTNDAGDLEVLGEGLFYTWPQVPGGMAERFETAQQGSEETGAPARPVVAADGDDLMSIMEAVGNWVYDYAGLRASGVAA